MLDDPARAFMGALFAAWVCDDEGLDAAAVAVRGQALEYWESAREAGTLPYGECPNGVSETIRAELLRRVGRFAESIEQAVATLALPDVHDVVELPLAYIADRAARGDRENHTVEEACEPQTSEFDPRLISHDQGIEYRRALIGGAIRTVLARERQPGESDDAIVFNGGDYYVQILLRPERLEIYAEAVDPDVWGTGSLSDDQRELLERLGWTPGGDDEPANYSRMFRGETPDELAAGATEVLEYTLRLVYGAGEACTLGVAVITNDKLAEEAENGEGRD